MSQLVLPMTARDRRETRRDRETVAPSTAVVQVHGVVDAVIYRKPDTGFSVLRVRTEAGATACVVGLCGTAKAGQTVRAWGQWLRHPQYGLQLKASMIDLEQPASAEGWQALFASGFAKGIGPKLARRIAERFGARLPEVLAESPERLREVPGMTRERIASFLAAWKSMEQERGVSALLAEYGFSPSLIGKVLKRYGGFAPEAIRQDPYRLARDIRGVGFVLADRVAQRVGIAAADPRRIAAAICHAVHDAGKHGHCGLPRDDVLDEAQRLLAVERDAIETVLCALERDRDPSFGVTSVRSGDVSILFDATLARAEARLAASLKALGARRPAWADRALAAAIADAERKAGIALTAQQRDALATALASGLSVITGGPGVGKTTILKVLLDACDALGIRAGLCAPTGRAAKRMREATGRKAQTIHRFLGWTKDGFIYGPRRPLPHDLIVVDEASMLDVQLADLLLAAVKPDGALVLIGDADQLPSVGPGRVLGDILDSGRIASRRLDRIFRQGADSSIPVAARAVLTGRAPRCLALDAAEDEGVFFVPAASPEEGAEAVRRLVLEELPARLGLSPYTDIQVLTPMKRGACGTLALNETLRRALFPQLPSGRRFAIGERVINLANSPVLGVANGDIGFVKGWDDPSDPRWKGAIVVFGDEDVRLPEAWLDNVAPAYALTVHKSQGSEFPAVVVPMFMEHYIMLYRNLLYTAITRARRSAVIVGDWRAVRAAVRTETANRRWTGLRDLLQSSWDGQAATRLPVSASESDRLAKLRGAI